MDRSLPLKLQTYGIIKLCHLALDMIRECVSNDLRIAQRHYIHGKLVTMKIVKAVASMGKMHFAGWNLE